MITAERLMLLGGISAFLLTIYWVRTRDLREKQAAIWIAASVVLLLAGFFPSILMDLADLAHLSYPTAILFVTLTAAYAFGFSVSVSISRQHRQTSRLVQEIAILQLRVHDLEKKLSSGAQGSTPENLRDAIIMDLPSS